MPNLCSGQPVAHMPPAGITNLRQASAFLVQCALYRACLAHSLCVCVSAESNTEINTEGTSTMFNRIPYAKVFATAACTMAIVLLTIGMGVNSSWAGSDQPSRLPLPPIPSAVVIQPETAARHPLRSSTSHPRIAQAGFCTADVAGGMRNYSVGTIICCGTMLLDVCSGAVGGQGTSYRCEASGQWVVVGGC